jgi:hypothetical protein
MNIENRYRVKNSFSEVLMSYPFLTDLEQIFSFISFKKPNLKSLSNEFVEKYVQCAFTIL